MHWTTDRLLELGRGYQPAAIFVAAAELSIFEALAPEPLSAAELARKLDCDLRALSILLDALAALQLLVRQNERYCLPPGGNEFLTVSGRQSVVAMAQHQANCLRRWAQLARVVKTGAPAERAPSVRGEQGDLEAFIGAMDNISAPVADQVIQAIQPLRFGRLLDVGGASGTWTMAFLRACPSATATLFDLPEVLPLARRRLAAVGMSERLRLVAGDYLTDPLPPGADLAWVSAIVHQNSRVQNRKLFARVFEALEPAGRLAIRDVLMDGTRTRPASGALFAVNMLVGTAGGGTFTFQELREDLQAAGFINPMVVRRDEGMNSILVAEKPQPGG